MNTTAAGAKGQLGRFYVKYSYIIDRVAKFVLGLVLFAGINQLTGFMKRLDSPIVVVGLAVICAFLPAPFLTLLGFVLLMVHLASLSLPVAGVVAVLFLIMYALYFHFTPGHTVMLLLVPIAFWARVPAVIPVAYGLLGGPAFAYPIACGCIAYYMIDYIHTYSKTFDVSGLAGIIEKVSSWVRAMVTNKEMWLYVFAFIICLWAVNLIRRRDVRHAWKLATVLGALIDVLILAIGAAVLGVKLNAAFVLISHAAAIVVGLVLEFLFFGVDYKHKESLQFEDDDYVYYVSAVPKIKGDEADQREVKRLTHEPPQEEREEREEQPIDYRPGPSREDAGNQAGNRQKNRQKKSNQPKQRDERKWEDGMTDELLMTQSLRRDLEKEL